jgi:hypothetical protein
VYMCVTLFACDVDFVVGVVCDVFCVFQLFFVCMRVILFVLLFFMYMWAVSFGPCVFAVTFVFVCVCSFSFFVSRGCTVYAVVCERVCVCGCGCARVFFARVCCCFFFMAPSMGWQGNFVHVCTRTCP